MKGSGGCLGEVGENDVVQQHAELSRVQAPEGVGIRAEGFEVRAWGSRFRVQGSGFRLLGLRYAVLR